MTLKTSPSLNTLKHSNPGLRILISVGGWTWSGAFSDVSLTAQSRERFISSAVRFVERYKLDGLDVDWEYPGQPGNGNTFRPEDKRTSLSCSPSFASVSTENRRAFIAACIPPLRPVPPQNSSSTLRWIRFSTTSTPSTL